MMTIDFCNLKIETTTPLDPPNPSEFDGKPPRTMEPPLAKRVQPGFLRSEVATRLVK